MFSNNPMIFPRLGIHSAMITFQPHHCLPTQESTLMHRYLYALKL
jgi:hypothetical protein